MKWIKPSEVRGKVDAPSSKSMMVRAAAASLLAEGETKILYPSFCDDALAGLKVTEALGAEIQIEGGSVTIQGGGPVKNTRLNCQQSGLCMRMFAPISALYNEKITLHAIGSLLSRPMSMIEGSLHQLGAECQTSNGFPPLTIQGPLKGGETVIDGSTSSQFLSGLLMALPLCKSDSELTVLDLRSKPYVAMTLSLLNHFHVAVDCDKHYRKFFIRAGQSYRNTTYSVEGDWSGAAFLLVAGAVCGKVSVKRLHTQSCQADKRILEALEEAGASVSTAHDSVTVASQQLRAFEFDATDCPDLFPPLVVLASRCKGRSLISGVDRLKHKESDRAQALAAEFSRLGAKVKIHNNNMFVTGTKLEGGIFDSHNDHRMAMAGAVAGLASKSGTAIRGWSCVSKSYPSFFEDLKAIGGEVV